MDELDIRECPICGNETNRHDMVLTYDCQGIPFRYVCIPCRDAIEEYDGEYYNELDENLDYDY